MNLPPPPKGQKGFTLDELQSKLPPPPTGQQGLSFDELPSDPHQELQQNVDTLINAKQKLGQDTSMFSGLKNSIKESYQSGKDMLSQAKTDIQGAPLGQRIGNAAQMVGGATAMVASPIAGAANAVISPVVDNLTHSPAANALRDSKFGQEIGGDFTRGIQRIGDAINPNVKNTIQGVGQTVMSALDLAGAGALGEQALKSGIGKNIVNKGTQLAKTTAQDLTAAGKYVTTPIDQIKPIKQVVKDALKDTPEQLTKTMRDNVQKALAPRGARTVGQLNTAVDSKVEGIKLLQRDSPKITVLDGEGVSVPYNPSKQGFSEHIQALKQSKDNLVTKANAELTNAENSGVTMDYTPTKSYLDDIANNGLTVNEKKNARIMLSEINNLERTGGSPLKLNEYLTKKNAEIYGSGKIGAVNQTADDAMGMLRDQIGTAMDRTSYGKEYGALKSVEGDMVRELQRVARRKGSGLEQYADLFANADIVNAVLMGNPAGLVKGGIIKTLTKALARSKDAEVILQKAFKAAEGLNTSSINPITEVKNIVKKKLPNSLPGFVNPSAIAGDISSIGKKKANTLGDDLVKEAKKYKSADEFVKAIDNQGGNEYFDSSAVKTTTGKPVIIKSFHGTDKNFENFLIPKKGVRYTGDGVYFFPDKETAKSYISGKENGRVVESYLDFKKPYNMYLPEGNIDWQPGNELLREIRAKGHDGIIVRMKDTDSVTGKVESDLINEIVAFDPKSIKTKDQLVEVWGKAQGTPKTARVWNKANK